MDFTALSSRRPSWHRCRKASRLVPTWSPRRRRHRLFVQEGLLCVAVQPAELGRHIEAAKGCTLWVLKFRQFFRTSEACLMSMAEPPPAPPLVPLLPPLLGRRCSICRAVFTAIVWEQFSFALGDDRLELQHV